MNRSQSIFRLAGRDLGYVLVMLGFSVLEFVVWVTGVSVTASLLVLIVGLPVWLATVYVFRRTAGLDRRVAGWYRRAPIKGVYRRPADRALLARVRVATTDRQTWRDLAWLVLNSTVGFVLATAALTVTGLAISYITMPLWWWAIDDPSKQYATLNLGMYTVTSTGWAFVTTGIGLLLLPVAFLINRGVAAGHARLAVRLLGPRASARVARPDGFESLAQPRSWSPAR
jgi:Putative sensor